MRRRALQVHLIPLTLQNLAFSSAGRYRNPDECVELRVFAALLNQTSEVIGREKTVPSRRFLALRNSARRIPVVVAAANCETVSAAQDRTVFVDGRSREVFMLEVLEKRLYIIWLNLTRLSVAETRSDLRQMVVKSAARVLPMLLPPVFKEFGKRDAVELAGGKNRPSAISVLRLARSSCASLKLRCPLLSRTMRPS